jgi:hypothetical protein
MTFLPPRLDEPPKPLHYRPFVVPFTAAYEAIQKRQAVAELMAKHVEAMFEAMATGCRHQSENGLQCRHERSEDYGRGCCLEECPLLNGYSDDEADC